MCGPYRTIVFLPAIRSRNFVGDAYMRPGVMRPLVAAIPGQ